MIKVNHTFVKERKKKNVFVDEAIQMLIEKNKSKIMTELISKGINLIYHSIK